MDRHTTSGSGWPSQRHNITPERKSSPAGVSPGPSPANCETPACSAPGSPFKPTSSASIPRRAAQMNSRNVGRVASRQTDGPIAIRIDSDDASRCTRPIADSRALATSSGFDRNLLQSGRGSQIDARSSRIRVFPMCNSPRRKLALWPGRMPFSVSACPSRTMFRGPSPISGSTRASTGAPISSVAEHGLSLRTRVRRKTARTSPPFSAFASLSQAGRLAEHALHCLSITIEGLA